MTATKIAFRFDKLKDVIIMIYKNYNIQEPIEPLERHIFNDIDYSNKRDLSSYKLNLPRNKYFPYSFKRNGSFLWNFYFNILVENSY